jgi:hypothetical protein
LKQSLNWREGACLTPKRCSESFRSTGFGRVCGARSRDRPICCGVLTGRDKRPRRLDCPTFHLKLLTIFPGSGRARPLDAIVGRLILMYLRDPASILSHFVLYIRPGELIVFQELALSMCRSEPSCPLLEKCGGWIHEKFVRAGADAERTAGPTDRTKRIRLTNYTVDSRLSAKRFDLLRWVSSCRGFPRQPPIPA